jgi:hypothetical protein
MTATASTAPWLSEVAAGGALSIVTGTLLVQIDERLDGGGARPLLDMADDGLDVLKALAREGFA